MLFVSRFRVCPGRQREVEQCHPRGQPGVVRRFHSECRQLAPALVRLQLLLLEEAHAELEPMSRSEAPDELVGVFRAPTRLVEVAEVVRGPRQVDASVRLTRERSATFAHRRDLGCDLGCLVDGAVLVQQTPHDDAEDVNRRRAVAPPACERQQLVQFVAGSPVHQLDGLREVALSALRAGDRDRVRIESAPAPRDDVSDPERLERVLGELEARPREGRGARREARDPGGRAGSTSSCGAPAS